MAKTPPISEPASRAGRGGIFLNNDKDQEGGHQHQPGGHMELGSDGLKDQFNIPGGGIKFIGEADNQENYQGDATWPAPW